MDLFLTDADFHQEISDQTTDNKRHCNIITRAYWKKCPATILLLSFIFGLLAAVISVIFCCSITRLLGTDTNTFTYVRQYLFFYGMGAPFIISNFALEQLIRGDGESVESMFGMMISVGTNIILDPILMFGFHLGIRGAAIATILGNATAVAYYIVCICRADNQLSALPKYFSLEKQMLNPRRYLHHLVLKKYRHIFYILLPANVLPRFQAPPFQEIQLPLPVTDSTDG